MVTNEEWRVLGEQDCQMKWGILEKRDIAERQKPTLAIAEELQIEFVESARNIYLSFEASFRDWPVLGWESGQA
jgi:hypothetical protein